LWYFREDLGANLHHWHWHLVYPNENRNLAMIKKDRRGELFYYMHQQVCFDPELVFLELKTIF
jgi:tyrosinase